jgi:hypothetical protein
MDDPYNNYHEYIERLVIEAEEELSGKDLRVKGAIYARK